MRVGIITFHRAHNHGAVLQSYALKRSLQKLNCEAKIVNYQNEHIRNIYENIKPFYLQRNIRKMIGSLLMYKKRIIKCEKFKMFINSELDGLDDIICNYERLANYDCDIFITGSDQVWNYKCSDYDKTYFLDFVKDGNKKNSYAASFGFSEIPYEYKEKYKILLKDFNKISVREKQGATIIRDLLGIDVPVVLDPIFLLRKNEWDGISTKIKHPEKYILMYLMGHSLSIIKYAKKLSKEKNMKVVFVDDSVLRIRGIKYMRSVGPTEWLWLFKNASYIVTNSFHGTAFAINFNKEFFVELLQTSNNVNSRLENILDIFDLRKRLIVNGENNVKELIDYVRINKILEEEREKSMKYLKSIIGDNRNE